MKRLIAAIFILSSIHSFGQDEGTITKRERIQRDKGIFVCGGLSIPGGSNFGDYSNGINFEAGYVKRLNRVISLGGSVSYLTFKYDAALSKKLPVAGQYEDNFFYSLQDGDGARFNFSGADISFLSLNGNFKFNFVPIKDNTKVSVYGFAKPFASMLKRSDLKSQIDYFTFSGNSWVASGQDEGVLEGESKFTGGVFLGPGLEINPTGSVSFFVQASFGYTFTTELISTKSFPRDLDTATRLDDFPFISSSFTSINFAAGISFNLD